MSRLAEKMELLERFAAGDLEAFETLFRQSQREVYGWIVRMVRDPAMAEDLTVETFWRAYRSRARFDATRSFGAWVRRIATNVALDHLKSSRRESALPENVSGEREPDPVLEREVREQVKRAFRALPETLQLTAMLALVEEQPYPEIAEAQGISVGAVKSRVFRAVRLLRKKLKQMGVEP